MKSIRMLAAASLLALGAVQPASAQETIKIGGLAPLSPPGGVKSGAAPRVGMALAVGEINAAGRIPRKPGGVGE